MIIAKGKEPERVKVRMQALFEKLRGAYPDKVVSGLDKDHKHWAETALELSRELGYTSKNEFLEAYGFRVVRKEPSAPTGRPTSVDSASVIKTLQARYPNGSGFSKLDDLFAANPDLLPFKKTLSNKANASFGMPLGQYLKQIGILNSAAESLEDKIRILQERYRDRVLPDTMAQLKSENADLKISAIDQLIRTQVKAEPIQFLRQKGVLSDPEKQPKRPKYIIEIKPITTDDSLYISTSGKWNISDDYVRVTLNEIEASFAATVKDIFLYESVSFSDRALPAGLNRIPRREFEKNLLEWFFRTKAVVETLQILPANTAAENTEWVGRKLQPDGEILWACIRGLATDVLQVLDFLLLRDNQTYHYKDVIWIELGVAELYVYRDDVRLVMENFPSVKIAMFSEHPEQATVFLDYSRSGCSFVTDSYKIGVYDPYSKNRWTVRHSPVEDFSDGAIDYHFRFHEEWNAVNYVVTDALMEEIC